MGTLQPWGHQGDGDTGAVGTPWGTVAVGTLWAWRHEWHGHGDTLAMEHGKAGRGQWPLGNGDHRDVKRPRGKTTRGRWPREVPLVCQGR